MSQTAFPADPQGEPQRIKIFRLVTKAFAAALFVFFALAWIGSAVDVQLPDEIMRLIRWGTGSEVRAYEMMISTIYLVWAPFIWIASRRPSENRLFLDFTLIANAAHFGLMAVQGMVFTGEHHHLYGDVLLGWLGLLCFGAAWLSVRHTLSATPSPQQPPRK